MELKEMMNRNIVDFNMKAANKEVAINKIAMMLFEDGRINSINEFVSDVFEREDLETTNMDIGVAIPHSQSLVVKKTAVALVKLDDEIDWEDYGEPVRIIFLLAVSPTDKGVEHLELISKIAELLIDEEFIAFLNKTKNINKLLRKMNKRMGR